MKKLILLFSVVLLASCSFYGTHNQDAEEVLVNSNAAELSTRITLNEAGAVLVTSANQGASKALAPTLATDVFPEDDTTPSTDQALTRIARVIPPVFNGRTLTASHVNIQGSQAFVGHNRMGPEYLGAIELVDVRVAHDPQILSQVIFRSMDVSAVLAIGEYVYFAGARDRDQFQGVEHAALLGRIRIEGNRFSNQVDVITLPGFAGTDLAFDGQDLFVSSGAEGGISRINVESFRPVGFWSKADVRSLAWHDGKLAVLSGTEGTFLYDADALDRPRNVSDRTSAPNAKRTISFFEEYLLVAEGERGAGIYLTRDGSRAQSVEIVRPVDDALEPFEMVTNAVSVTDDIMWLANGAAGLSMARYADGAFTTIGFALLGGSANYIQAQDEFIFAAAGSEGLQILRRELPDEQIMISCEGAVPYNGPSWLNVNSNDEFIYSGSASLQGINVNNRLTFCGSLVVSNQLNINSNAVFNMRGSMAFGQLWGNTSLIINSGSVLRIEGSVVIYGNLIMNSNSAIEFVGEGNSITIHGSVTRNSNTTITGSFTDVLGKL